MVHMRVKMMTKRKLQVFISSTYLDLKDERQVAVEAILGAGHIPAGMELFKAGNNSQLVTIKKWIDQSDVYMLILGGRYGSVEESSGKSYTQLEYEYAINKNIPVFAVVLSSDFLKRKSLQEQSVYEEKYKESYKQFKDFVKTKMIKEINEIKDIKIAIYESLKELEEENDFSGWIPGNSFTKSQQNALSLKSATIKDLKKQISILEKEKLHSKLEKTYEALSKKVELHLNEGRSIPKYYSITDTFFNICPYLQKKDLSHRKIKRILDYTLYTNIDINSFGNIVPFKLGTSRILDSDLEKILFILNNAELIDKYITDFGRTKYEITDLGCKFSEYILENR